MIVENVVHESKWGFHSVSKEAYSKLRFLNAIYDKSLHLAAAWERWNNKLPKNRIQKRAIRDDKGWKINSEIVLDLNGNPISLIEPKLCPLFHNFAKSKWSDELYVQDNGFGGMILLASRQAKIPHSKPELAKPLLISDEEIDRLYNIGEEWSVGK